MVKISVIVPIYNVEKQLDRCIKSLMKQKIDGIQVILINDGSTDLSGNIAKQYAEQYPNQIIYIEKDNSGLSETRNYGVKYATGEYIAFVDSDDYITENLFSDLEQYIEQKYDMIKFKIANVDEEGKIIKKNYTPLFENKTGEEAFEILYKEDVMTEVAWGYLYKRQFFLSNKFEFEKGKFHEDFGLIPIILVQAKKVAAVDIFGYNYVQTQKSITRGNEQLKYQRALDLLYHYDKLLEKIKKINISQKTKENLKLYYTNCIILEIKNLDKKQKKYYIKEIRNRKMIRNVKVRNFKQLIKRIILTLNIGMYLKLRK